MKKRIMAVLLVCTLALSMCTVSAGEKEPEEKNLIAELKETNRDVEANIFRSMENIHLAAVLGYKDKEKVRHSFLEDYDRTAADD